MEQACLIWPVIPAMRDGSPAPASWSPGRNQFQHVKVLAEAACSG